MSDSFINILPTLVPNIVTVISILSSILICIINNRHQLQEAEQKFKHESEKDVNKLIYIDKKNAYYGFLCKAGAIAGDFNNINKYQELLIATYNAMMFSDYEIEVNLRNFLNFVNKRYHDEFDYDVRENYNKLLDKLSESLSSELYKSLDSE